MHPGASLSAQDTLQYLSTEHACRRQWQSSLYFGTQNSALMAYVRDVKQPGLWAYDWPLRNPCTDDVEFSKELLQARLMLAARPPWRE